MATTGTRRWPGWTASRRSRRTRRLSSTATRPDWPGAQPGVAGRRRPGAGVRRRAPGPRGAQTAVDAGLRIDTQVMLTDDPVKRVDNMTMAHGLEARVPFLDHEFVELAASCPPELKLAQGGKGVLKEIGRRVLPHEVIDRPKGYFPVPGLTHLEGKLLDRVRDALTAPEARRRDLFRADYVDALLADPNAELTR
ncbi:asparagine synthase-related protein [Micromonospora sp. BRA006-A]|nr:asparagine synthase-related protein [Micromonospora sp. BRA006-A]